VIFTIVSLSESNTLFHVQVRLLVIFEEDGAIDGALCVGGSSEILIIVELNEDANEPSFVLIVQFHNSYLVVFPLPRVVMIVLLFTVTPDVFPPKANTELLYHQYSAVTVLCSASYSVALHCIFEEVFAMAG